MEKLHAWQPVTFIKGRNHASLGFLQVTAYMDHLKISFTDETGALIEVIYDQPISPVEYYVWSYRFSTEYGRFDLLSREREYSGLKDKDALHFYKVSNSEYIEWFDRNPLVNSKTHPALEHHLYLSGNEIVEVLSEYEPRFIKVEQ
ncbi:hypothetical protein [Planomicrobium sp. YIM 101495]|uniref:hypothetical protein n=1 Tax=Planomicrobium sp. YIM 101495 TaxID=2665160 RepID=UPI0012B85C73|nr:hypothetical protein [Planomicrobium sp. YIM 101495]MTD31370.1 hypothetical protein [Planomicrobium sp. YIM 101495]